MIDLHCHLLPGVDDGPETLDESIAMARAAYDDGVRAIVVTPHAGPWSERYGSDNPREALQAQVQELQRALLHAGIALTLYPGMELELDMDLPGQLRAGRALPLGSGPYFLLELPFFQHPLYLEQTLFQAQLQGWKPVLAHVERYLYVQQAPDMLAPLVERGILVQVTAGSLLGAAGPVVRSTAQHLLRRGLVHILASDGHAARGPRSPRLRAGVEAAARLIGPERAQAMVAEVPQQIVEGHR